MRNLKLKIEIQNKTTNIQFNEAKILQEDNSMLNIKSQRS